MRRRSKSGPSGRGITLLLLTVLIALLASNLFAQGSRIKTKFRTVPFEYFFSPGARLDIVIEEIPEGVEENKLRRVCSMVYMAVSAYAIFETGIEKPRYPVKLRGILKSVKHCLDRLPDEAICIHGTSSLLTAESKVPEIIEAEERFNKGELDEQEKPGVEYRRAKKIHYLLRKYGADMRRVFVADDEERCKEGSSTDIGRVLNTESFRVEATEEGGRYPYLFQNAYLTTIKANGGSK